MYEEPVCTRIDSFFVTRKRLCLYMFLRWSGSYTICGLTAHMIITRWSALCVVWMLGLQRTYRVCVVQIHTLTYTESGDTSALNKCLYRWKHAVCELPAGLWADMVLAVTESHLPVLPLPLEGGEGEERGEGLCCDTQWATAKPKCDICACVNEAHRVI